MNLQLVYNVARQGEFRVAVQSVQHAVQMFLAHRDGEMNQPFAPDAFIPSAINEDDFRHGTNLPGPVDFDDTSLPLVIDLSRRLIVARLNYNGTIQ